LYRETFLSDLQCGHAFQFKEGYWISAFIFNSDARPAQLDMLVH